MHYFRTLIYLLLYISLVEAEGQLTTSFCAISVVAYGSYPHTVASPTIDHQNHHYQLGMFCRHQHSNPLDPRRTHGSTLVGGCAGLVLLVRARAHGIHWELDSRQGYLSSLKSCRAVPNSRLVR